MQELITSINNAFYRVESYLAGRIKDYKYFGFDNAFTQLFLEAKKVENYSYEICKLIGHYWNVAAQISYDIDKGEYENKDIYENEDFSKDTTEIYLLSEDRIEEFIEFSTPDEIEEAERKVSITDIFKPINKQEAKPAPEHSLTDFFNRIRDFSITDLEIYNTIEKLTDNFAPDKLQLLINDFNLYLSIAKENMIAEFSDKEINDAIKDLKKRGKEIPMTRIAEMKDKNGNIVPIADIDPIIDLEKLLFPYDFFGCYKFKSLITKWSNEHLKLQSFKTTAKSSVSSKPNITFSPEAIPEIFNVLKDFFSPEHQTILIQIMKSGDDAPEPLIFLANGNRLADAFKMLKEYDFITGCEKKELEAWISRNFKYRHNRMIKDFTLRYLNDIISTTKDKCRHPLINFRLDKSVGKYSITKS